MRDKSYDHFMDYKECWRLFAFPGCSFSSWTESAWKCWWQKYARNPHGWDITIKARGIRK